MTTPSPMPDIAAAPSFDAAADALFSFASEPEADSTQTEETPAPDAEQPEDQSTEETEQPAEQTEPVEDPLDDDLNPDKEEEKLHFYSKAKSARLQEANKFYKALQQEIPGANLETIRAINQTAAGAERMTAEFDSGDPALVGNVVNFFTNPPEGATPEQLAAHSRSVEILAEGILDRLPQINPQAAERLGTTMVQNYVSSLYEKATLDGNQNLFALAQHMDMQLRGKCLTPENFQKKTPEQQEIERLRATEQQYQQKETQAQQAQAKAYTAETTGKVNESLNDEIAKAIPENIRKAYEAKPEVWQRIVRDFREAVDKAATSNQAWLNRFKSAQRQAQQTRREGDREQLLAMVRTFAQPVIKSQRKAILDFYAANGASANAAAHQTQQSAARRDGTTSSAPTLRKTGGPDMSKINDPATSYDEAWNELLRS